MADPTPLPESLGLSTGDLGIPPQPGGQGYFTAEAGPGGLNCEFTVENDTIYNRKEVIGVMAPFPQGPNGVEEGTIADYHFQPIRAKEVIGVGDGGVTTSFSSTLSWPGQGFSDITPGTVVVTVVCRNPALPANPQQGIEVVLTDDGSGTITPDGTHLSSGSVNYSTGAISLSFNGFLAAPFNGKDIKVEYGLVDPPTYPTDWTILTTWPDGKVRFAKGWCGNPDGTGADIPRSNVTTDRRCVTVLKMVKNTSMTGLLPTYAQHAAVTAGLATGTPSNLTSFVNDAENNRYAIELLDSAQHYEDVTLEDTAWMKVIRRRSYHANQNTTVGATDRDFLSLTWYLYIPHNSRYVDLELRLGNDYQGSDPTEHTDTLVLGTGDGIQTSFSGTLPLAGNTHRALEVRRESVDLTATIGGTLYTWLDTNGAFVEDKPAPALVSGSIDYGTGAVSVNFPTAPDQLSTISISYKSWYTQLYTGDGATTSFSGQSLPSRPSAYSVHVQAGSLEGKDDGKGNIVPYIHTNTKNEALAAGDGSTTNFSGTLANAPVLMGHVEIRVAEDDNDNGTKIFGRDDGAGNITGPGISSGTITYTTGAYNITLSSGLRTGEFLYVDYSYDAIAAGTAYTIGGTVNYTTGALNLTFETAPADTEKLLVSYIRNGLSTSFDQDPNMHPLGNIGFSRWCIESRTGQVKDVHVEAGGAYGSRVTTGQPSATQNTIDLISGRSATGHITHTPNASIAAGSTTIQTAEDVSVSEPSITGPGKVYIQDVDSLGYNYRESCYRFSSVTAGTPSTFNLVTDAGSGTLSGSSNSGTSLRDTSADFGGADTVVPGDVVYNNTTGEAATVIEIISPSELFTTKVSGKGIGIYTAGDSYSINVVDRDITTSDVVVRRIEIASGGFNEDFVHEHLADGSSVARMVYLYFGDGATSAEDDNFTAKKTHALTAIASRDTFNQTRAVHLFEGGIKFVTPEQTSDYQHGAWSDESQATVRDFTRSASSEDLARFSNGGGGVSSGPPSNALTAVAMWNYGTPVGPKDTAPPGSLHGVRGTLGWRPNYYRPGTGGAPRNGHFFSQVIWASQAWQAVRYFYHAGLHGYTRPGYLFWNFENAHGWRTRPVYLYHLQHFGKGLIPKSPTGVSTEKETLSVYNQHFLNRGYRSGYGADHVTATGSQTTVSLDANAGNPSVLGGAFSPHFYIDGDDDASTVSGASVLGGRKKIVIEGSRTVYGISSISYNSGNARWEVTLDQSYDGRTQRKLRWAAVNDPTPGEDTALYPRNDPRSFARARMGYRNPYMQHNFEAENATHSGQDAPFEAWCATGSWLIWDQVRHVAEYYLGALKDHANGSGESQLRTGKQRGDQIRYNAWSLKHILSAFLCVKYLQDQAPYSFLTSSTYGKAGDRYREYMQSRMGWWLTESALGLMDPSNQIVPAGGGYPERIKDCRVSHGEPEADWGTPQDVGGSAPEIQGITGMPGGEWVGQQLSDAQVRFGEEGFSFAEIWQQGYLTPYLWSMWREFRLDTTPVELKSNSNTFEDFNQILFRLCIGHTNFLLDYGFEKGFGPFPGRDLPGFIALHTNMLTVLSEAEFPVTAQLNSSFTTHPVKNPATFPTNLDDNDAPTQLYYLRLGSPDAAATLTGPAAQSGQPNVEAIGLPIPGTGRHPGNAGDLTTFEDGMPFAGEGRSDFVVPSCTNPLGSFPCYRAPTKVEGYSVVGHSFSFAGLASQYLNSAVGPALLFATRWHSDPNRQQQAADILNNWIWQHIAYSNIDGVYNGLSTKSTGYRIETDNWFIGPVTGDFPHVPGGVGGDPTFWWDTAWLRRTRVESDDTHSVYEADLDVFRVNISTYGVPDHTQSGLGDIRVIYQLSDGSSTVLNHAVRQDPTTGNWNLFFKPSVEVAENEEIHLSPDYAFYIYYDNASAPAPTAWLNKNSIDGPFSSDSNTIALWNSEGSVHFDETGNFPTTSAPGRDATHITGPFGGASDFDASLSQQNIVAPPFAAGTALEPADDLTIEFWFYMDARDFVGFTSGTGGSTIAVASMWDDTQNSGAAFPLLVSFKGGPDDLIVNKNIELNCLLRIEAPGGVENASASIGSPAGYQIGTGNGSNKTFAIAAPIFGLGIRPDTVRVVVKGRTVLGEDSTQTGDIIGPGISIGVINYTSGAGTVTFVDAPANGDEVWIFYGISFLVGPLGKPVQYTLNRWQHARFIHTSGSGGLGPYLNGEFTAAQLVGPQGSLERLTNPFSIFSIGAINTPRPANTNFLSGGLAEFRYSAEAISPLMQQVETAATITLDLEEALEVTNELSIPADSEVSKIAMQEVHARAVLQTVDNEASADVNAHIILFVGTESADVEAVVQLETILALPADAAIAVTRVGTADNLGAASCNAALTQRTLLYGDADSHLAIPTTAFASAMAEIAVPTIDFVDVAADIAVPSLSSADLDATLSFLNLQVFADVSGLAVNQEEKTDFVEANALVIVLTENVEEEADCDAYILGSEAVEIVAADAVLYLNLNAELTLSSEAVLAHMLDTTADLSAVLQISDLVASADLDAVAQVALSASADVNAEVASDSFFETLDVQAVLEFQGATSSVDIEGHFVIPRQASSDLDSLLAIPTIDFVVAGAAFATPTTDSADINAVVQLETAASVDCNAYVEGQEMVFDLLADAAIQIQDVEGPANLDSLLAIPSTASADLIASVTGIKTASVDLIATLFSALNQVAAVDCDAHLSVPTISVPVDMDAVLQTSEEASVSCDAQVIQLGSVLSASSPSTITPSRNPS